MVREEDNELCCWRAVLTVAVSGSVRHLGTARRCGRVSYFLVPSIQWTLLLKVWLIGPLATC